MKLVISNGSRLWGGAERIAEVLALWLQQRGHQVVCFCRRGSPLHQRLEPHLTCEPVLGGSRFHPSTVWRAARALRRHAPEVVIGNTIKEPAWVGVAAHQLGVPFVYRHEVNEPFRDNRRDRWMYGRFPARIVVSSLAVRRTLLDGVGWLRPERVVVVPNGVDFGGIERAEPASLGLPEGAVVFGFVGRLEELKGIGELAEAWPWVYSAVPNAHLVIAGSGALEQQLRNWLADVPNVHLLGYREDVAAVMKALDVLVVPSHREGFCLVAVEAMAAGAAVVASDTSSFPELIRDGVEGRLVAPRDVDALCDAMIQVASDDLLRRRMGQAGRERARSEFPLERMLLRHEELLAGVAAEGVRRDR